MSIIQSLKMFSTPILSDALDSLGIDGGLCGIRPRIKDCNICGQAFTVLYREATLKEKLIGKAADFIDDVSSNEIVILANAGKVNCTIWGGILTRMAVKKRIEGTIIDGACRDIDEIERYNYPVFSKGIYMKSGKGRVKKIDTQVPVKISSIEINPGDYIRGDRNGVIVIPKDVINEVLLRASFIKQTEDLIIAAVDSGMSLKDARKKYNYHKPWQDNTKNE